MKAQCLYRTLQLPGPRVPAEREGPGQHHGESRSPENLSTAAEVGLRGAVTEGELRSAAASVKVGEASRGQRALPSTHTWDWGGDSEAMRAAYSYMPAVHEDGALTRQAGSLGAEIRQPWPRAEPQTWGYRAEQGRRGMLRRRREAQQVLGHSNPLFKFRCSK